MMRFTTLTAALACHTLVITSAFCAGTVPTVIISAPQRSITINHSTSNIASVRLQDIASVLDVRAVGIVFQTNQNSKVSRFDTVSLRNPTTGQTIDGVATVIDKKTTMYSFHDFTVEKNTTWNLRASAYANAAAKVQLRFMICLPDSRNTICKRGMDLLEKPFRISSLESGEPVKLSSSSDMTRWITIRFGR